MASHAAVETGTTKATLEKIRSFVAKFLESADGGARLSAVIYAYFSLIHSDYTVKVYNANVSDAFAGTAGDVEIRDKAHIISAVECKHRPINLDDVKHGIRKAIEKGLSEYVFVAAAGEAIGQETAIFQEVENRSDEIDLTYISISEVSKYWTGVINPRKRPIFGSKVVEALVSMRRNDIAKIAADFWNDSE